MTKAEAEKFFELLADIVNGSKPYTQKRDELLGFADEADQNNLEELASWFGQDG